MLGYRFKTKTERAKEDMIDVLFSSYLLFMAVVVGFGLFWPIEALIILLVLAGSFLGGLLIRLVFVSFRDYFLIKDK